MKKIEAIKSEYVADNKVLSIIIPCYNVEKKLFEACISSLECEENRELDIIVVDDGSEEKYQNDIAEVIECSSLKIRLFQKANGGQNSARLFGLNYAIGEYIFFLDADDYVEPSVLDDIIYIIKRKRPKILAYNYDVRSQQGKCIRRCMQYPDGIKSMDIRQGIINSASLCMQIYQRQLIVGSEVEFPQNARIGEDMAVSVALLITAGSAVTLGKCFYHYVRREGSILSAPPADAKYDIITAFTKMIESIEADNIEKYKEELEWLAIFHVLYHNTERALNYYDGDEMVIRKNVQWINDNFPNWKRNRYLRHQPRKIKNEIHRISVGSISTLKFHNKMEKKMWETLGKVKKYVQRA